MVKILHINTNFILNKANDVKISFNYFLFPSAFFVYVFETVYDFINFIFNNLMLYQPFTLKTYYPSIVFSKING